MAIPFYAVSPPETDRQQMPLGQESISPVSFQTLIDSFLARRSPNTRRAYEKDLADFATYLQVGDNQAALLRLVTAGQGQANASVLGYKAALQESGKSPNTINRRLATLRSAIKLANTLGLVNWTISVENERTEAYRDTTGTGIDGFRAILKATDTCRNRNKAIRDKAILRLLFDLALRRGEVASLNLADLDLDSSTLKVLGKGRSQQITLTLPAATVDVLRAWIEVRGTEPGSLFVNFDRAAKGIRLTGTAIYRIVRDLGRKSGIAARPHGLRHAAITEALDLTRGDVRSVQRSSRHRNLQTLLVYDDNRQDLAGAVAKSVSARV
jgi:integrase/recombinase XerC